LGAAECAPKENPQEKRDNHEDLASFDAFVSRHQSGYKHL